VERHWTGAGQCSAVQGSAVNSSRWPLEVMQLLPLLLRLAASQPAANRVGGLRRRGMQARLASPRPAARRPPVRCAWEGRG